MKAIQCPLDAFTGTSIAINQVEYSWTPEGPIIHIFGRDTSGNPHRIDVNGVRPYFYAPEEQARASKNPKAFPELGTTYRSIRGSETLCRIYTLNPGDVRDVRDRFRHYEADIPFATRFMLDSGLTGGVYSPADEVDHTALVPAEVDAPARSCIIDIECTDERGFPDAMNDEIIAITAYDSFADDYVTFVYSEDAFAADAAIEAKRNSGGLPSGCFTDRHATFVFSDEVAMLKAFTDYIIKRDPDILSGWNFIDFDMPYISNRMLALGLNPASLARLPGMTERNAMRGRALFDLLTAYKKMHLTQKESYRLDAIALAEVGEQKVRYTGTIANLWRTQPALLIEYNFKDVELCVKIDKKDDIVGFYREIARYVGCPLDKTPNSSSVVDVFVLRKASGKFVLPSKGMVTADEFEGATVFEPSRGVRENVVVLDLKSLYPMAMMTINASPETKDPEGELVAPNGIRFRKKPDGLTRTIIAELLKERDEKKALRNMFEFGSQKYKMYDMQQNVIKVIMNTYYGVSGYPRFRLFDPDIGSAVTSVGRAIIEHTRKVVEGMGYKVLYGDSVGGDSLIPLYDSTGNSLGSIPIASLFTSVNHKKDDGREYSNVTGFFTDTLDASARSVLRPIKYVMRHKTNKRMYRIWLNNETKIDVTEDHSLFGYIGKSRNPFLSAPNRIVEVKPSEIGKTTSSLVVKKNVGGAPEADSGIDFEGCDYNISHVKKVEEIEYNDYVYDIEVEDTHRFFANNILVHNTDSCMVQLPANLTKEQTIVIARAIEKELNASYPGFALQTLNADTQFFSIKFEKIYARFFQAGKKKRYAGLLVWKEGKDVKETDIVGFETKRSDTPKIVKEVQKKVMEQILEGVAYSDIHDYLSGIIRQYRAGKYSLDEIGIPGGLGKHLNEYETDDAQVRGAKYSNRNLGTEFGRGSKPKRLYIKTVTARYPKTDVVCFEYADQVPKEFVVDTELMLEKTLKNPISRVIEALGWEWNDIDPTRTTLGQFGLG